VRRPQRDPGSNNGFLSGPCHGVASPPPLIPEADSFSWMVVRPYGVGKLKLSPFLVFDRKRQKPAFRIPVWIQGRRHGFESGGRQFCERSEPKNFLDPPTFWPVGGGTKYCLDS